tara:strand:- start:591 stop:1490 length:900 start_codon:yes stop_codon:yes gene_type:complete
MSNYGVDLYRKGILSREWQVNSFRKDHAYYAQAWKSVLGPKPTAKEVKELGESLRDIMKSLGGGGRGQGSVSAAGTAFESIVSWYLNLLFWGTPIVVGRRHQTLPKVFDDITTVMIDGKKSNTETDLVAFYIPDAHEFNGNESELNDHLISKIKDVDLSIIQTKTTWNENSQIPMLWDMIYNVREFRARNITIGTNGFSPHSLNVLKYAFVTMPSQKNLDKFKSSSISVKRVKTLSGGNYWCCPTKDDVVSSIHEFPIHNFPQQIAETDRGNLWGHLQSNIDRNPRLLDSFVELNVEML